MIAKKKTVFRILLICLVVASVSNVFGYFIALMYGGLEIHAVMISLIMYFSFINFVLSNKDFGSLRK